MARGLRGMSRREWLRATVAGIAGAGLSVPLIYGWERLSLSVSRDRLVIRNGPPRPFAQIEGDGLIRPPTSAIEESGMRGDDPIIGVEVGGLARAYRLDALRGRTRHVVNDLLGGVPVTVSYCDMNDCVRAYTDPRGTAPLGFTVGGLYVDNGPQMVLKLDGVFYFQKSGKPIQPGPGPMAIPYDILDPTRTTWKEWVRLHPETDVYVGDREDDRKSPSGAH